MRDNEFSRVFNTAEQIINDFRASGKFNPLSDFDTIEEKRFAACRDFMNKLAEAAEELDGKLKELSE